MFFSSAFSKGLKPVCIMGGSHFHCPGFHAGGNLVGNFAVDLGAFFNGFKNMIIGFV